MKAKHVIFRSKGCRTCRARKVKCDEARPVCQRCVRARFECHGYSHPTTFLSDNPQARDSSSASSSKSGRSQSKSISPVPRALPYPVELTSVAFLVRSFSIGTPGDRRGFSWLRQGLEEPDQSSLFSITSRCLAEVYYGRVFNKEDIFANGMAKYGNILSRLRQQLQVPEFLRSNDLMAVVMTVSVIESVSNQSTVGLFAHLHGLTEMVRRVGPQAFQRRPDILIFEMCRCFLIARGIKARHKTFVAEPEWKIIPWIYEGKTIAVRLWDIIADIPSLTFDLKCLEQSGGRKEIEGSRGYASTTYLKLTSIFQHLFDWRWEWERQFHGSAAEVPVTTSDLVTDGDGNPWYPTLLQLSNRWRATEILYYNATLIYLFRMAHGLQWHFVLESTDRASPQGIMQPLPPSSLLLPRDIHNLEDAKSEFYRSMEGCLRVTTLDSGHWYQLMFSLALVTIDMDKDSLEALWMWRIRKKITSNSRLDIWAAARRSIASPV